jgi:hypothetical protein
MSAFLKRLLAGADDVRIGRDDLTRLMEHSRLGFPTIPDATDEQLWHLETIRLYNLGLHRFAEQGSTDSVYLEQVRLIHHSRHEMARRHEADKVLGEIHTADGTVPSPATSPPPIHAKPHSDECLIKELESNLLHLLRKHKPRPRAKQAAMVEAMIGKQEDTIEALRESVYGDQEDRKNERTDDALRNLAGDLTDSARQFNIPLVYEVRCGRIFKTRLSS